MLIVAFLFAASINYDKIAMLNSDPVFGMAFTLLAISGALILISGLSFVAGRKVPQGNRSLCTGQFTGTSSTGPWKFLPWFGPVILVAFFAAVEAVSINIAYTIQIVPYVIAIKRLSIIFMVLYGTVICHERGIATRFAGAVIMVGGAMIIILFA